MSKYLQKYISISTYILSVFTEIVYFMFYDSLYISLKSLPIYLIIIHTLLYEPYILTYLLSLAFLMYGIGNNVEGPPAHI